MDLDDFCLLNPFLCKKKMKTLANEYEKCYNKGVKNMKRKGE